MDNQNTTFIFQGYNAEIEKGEIAFYYRLQLLEEEITFTEKVSFPSILPNTISPQVLEAYLNNLLLILGISYWKLYCPKNIKIESFSLTKEQADFWNTVYTKGLGEFFYRNNIDYHGVVMFPFDDKVDGLKRVHTLPRQNRSLLLIGGGKDSLVSAELLKKYRKLFTAFTINPKDIHEETISIIGSNKLFFKRVLDPKLFELNKQEDTYNGHIPASAQYAFLALLAALLYDYRYIIASNEKSANYGNVEYLGEEINHQWSKSQEFERSFQEYVKKYITEDITYFSLLRSFNEIKITQLFSQYKQYFSVFTSCNRNFRITGEANNKLWCGECPKCTFVFTMLAAFLTKEEVEKIFGKNLFADKALAPLYRELLGLGQIKPFECVGTPEEMQYAMYVIHQKNVLSKTPIMQMVENESLLSQERALALKDTLFTLDTNNLPDEFSNLL